MNMPSVPLQFITQGLKKNYSLPCYIFRGWNPSVLSILSRGKTVGVWCSQREGTEMPLLLGANGPFFLITEMNKEILTGFGDLKYSPNAE